MAKPRRSTRQEFYDVFSDFPIEDQAIVLEFLQEIHRMAKRRKPEKTPEPANPPPSGEAKPNVAPQPVATLLDDQSESEAIR